MSKNRNWNITINKGAECYELVPMIIHNLKCQYAYITHDPNEEQEHIHLCLLLESPRDFTTIQKHFPGSHIEPMRFKNDSIQYLIHKNDKEKKQYDISAICSNIPDLESIINDEPIEYFNPRLIHIYFIQGCHTFTNYYIRFGVQVKPYMAIIKEIISDMRTHSQIREQIREEYESNESPF